MQDSKMQNLRISEEEILKTFELLTQYHEKYLKDYGVKSIKLKDSKGNYTKDALTLVYLAQNYPNTQAVSKAELTDFIRKFYPDVSDVQQARHLSKQGGFYIISGNKRRYRAKNSSWILSTHYFRKALSLI